MKNKMFWEPWNKPVVGSFPLVKVWQPTGCRADKVGKGTIIGAFCDIGALVKIGVRCLIQSSCLISNGVKIGDECFLGPRVNILNDKYMDGIIESPIIGNRVRIGGSTIINPGVRIEDDVFICSGALITKNVPKGTRVMPDHENKGRVVW